MKLYNVSLENIYYDGDDFVLAGTDVDVKTYTTLKDAKEFVKCVIDEEKAENPHFKYKKCEDNGAVLYDKVDGEMRNHVILTIHEVEI